MASHARHARSAPTHPTALRPLMRLGLSVSAGAALVGAGATTAQAAEPKAPRVVFGDTSLGAAFTGTDIALEEGAKGAFGSLKTLQLDPLAGTGTDPLSNSVNTQVEDVQLLDTSDLTGPLAQGDAIGELPLVTDAATLLPG
ncbi:hypothetical protein ACFP1Z_02380 [Streptomyces gamaensis]|uniref:ATP-binding protein n=1 Tax=Streptomyces gamaensis TaxID=1763542 RepID=A0ABW0YUV1_9ACTN